MSEKNKTYILEFMNGILYDEKNIEKNSDNKDYLDNMEDFSELRIHKILYFLYGFFYKKYKVDLFDANFQAWMYGPVEINYRYKNHKEEGFEISFTNNQSEFVYNTLKNLMKQSTWDLVELSHLTKPWKDISKSGRRFAKIPNELIKEYFLNLEGSNEE